MLNDNCNVKEGIAKEQVKKQVARKPSLSLDSSSDHSIDDTMFFKKIDAQVFKKTLQQKKKKEKVVIEEDEKTSSPSSPEAEKPYEEVYVGN